MTVKQKTLQSAHVFRSALMVCGALCGSCIAIASTTVQTMPRTPGETSATMQLIAAPGLTAGGYEAGIDIRMSRGSHTYWKMPGEAGVPPVFAFDGSENVASATVLYAVPRRLTEDGLDAFGYVDGVVFPVRVIPQDPARPTVLHVDVTYAVCNKICLPAHDKATLMLEPGARADAVGMAASDLVETAFAQIPKPATDEQRAALSIARLATPAPSTDKSRMPTSAKPSWTLTWRGQNLIDDIFAEAPDGCFFTTKKTGDSTWSLVADQIAGSAATVPVSLTLRQKFGSDTVGGLVMTEKLDVTAPIQ